MSTTSTQNKNEKTKKTKTKTNKKQKTKNVLSYSLLAIIDCAQECIAKKYLNCALFAKYGALESLKWARANGAPWDRSKWDTSTCANAARGNHLEVLKWARENGAPWDEDTCDNAADNDHL